MTGVDDERELTVKAADDDEGVEPLN